jgi:hypothetical protein
MLVGMRAQTRLMSLQEFEPSAFIAKFSDWCAELFAPLPSNYATAQMSHYRIAPTEPWPKISIGTARSAPSPSAPHHLPLHLPLTDSNLHTDQVVNLRRPPQEPFVDEGGGSVEVWAIEDGKPTFTKLPADERGHFYSGGTKLFLSLSLPVPLLYLPGLVLTQRRLL